jgi:hypothetical protein
MRILLPCLLLGCSGTAGSPKEETGGDADTDADTDSDSDTDAREPTVNADCTATIFDDNLVQDILTVRSYDSWGDRVGETIDAAADGTVEDRFAYTFDALGQLTLHEAFKPLDGDALDHTWTYTYAGRNLIEEVEDAGADGDWEVRWTHGYDGSDAIWSLKESGLSGGDDDRIDRTFDSSSHLLEVVHDDLDDDVPDRLEHYGWSGDQLTTEAFDDDASGSPDRGRVHTWSSGHITRTDHDDDGDGDTDFRDTFVWTGDQLTSEQRDEDLDGTAEHTIEWSYDSGGHVLREYHYYPRLETPEWEVVWTYDSEGRELSETRQWDGTVFYLRTTEWDCP